VIKEKGEVAAHPHGQPIDHNSSKPQQQHYCYQG
jgi:hypothetical protein